MKKTEKGSYLCIQIFKGKRMGPGFFFSVVSSGRARRNRYKLEARKFH